VAIYTVNKEPQNFENRDVESSEIKKLNASMWKKVERGLFFLADNRFRKAS